MQRKIPDGYRPLSKELRDRIVKAQKHKGLKDEEVAAMLGTLLDKKNTKNDDFNNRVYRYKNYKNDSTSLTKISDQLLYILAEIFDTTYSYLVYGKTENDAGMTIKRPTYDIMIKYKGDLIKSLFNDDESVKALHFLYCEIPEEESSNYINAFITFIKCIQDNSYLSLTEKSLFKGSSAIRKFFEMDGFYGDLYIKLAEADECLKIQNHHKALNAYLELLLSLENFSKGENKYIKEVIVSRLAALRYWTGFPKEIEKVFNEIKAMTLGFDEFPQVKGAIEVYLSKCNNSKPDNNTEIQ